MKFQSHTNQQSKFESKVAHGDGPIAKGGGRKHVRVFEARQGVTHMCGQLLHGEASERWQRCACDTDSFPASQPHS